MKLAITLGDADIKAALIAHAKSSLNITLADESVTVNLTTGRKGNGATAEIVIGSDEPAVAVETTPIGSVGEVVPAVEVVGESAVPVPVEEEVELPAPTPETAGHETKTSLFG